MKRLWVENNSDGTWQAHSDNGATLTIGRGEGQFSPVDLMKIALAACSGMTSHVALERLEIPKGSIRIVVDGNYDSESGAIMNFSEDIVIDTHGSCTNPQKLGQLKDKAHDFITRGCTVKKTYEIKTPVRASITTR